MTDLRSGISIIIPVYNSEKSLFALISRLKPALDCLGRDYELILVNDGSKDRSWDLMHDLTRDHGWIRAINLMRNYGQHNALLCGMRAAQFDITVTMDDDLQNPPEEIPLLLDALDKGYDVVYGTPSVRQHGLWRNLAAQITKLSFRAALGSEIAYQSSAFRAFRTALRNAFADYRGSFVSIDVLLTWGTSHFTSVTVRFEPRHAGVSNYTFAKLAVHALNMVTGFSTLPLRLASFVGFGFMCFVIGRYLLQGSSVPGFPFLASVIAIFSGVQLFCLGIIGEYLARMHFRMMERPTYAIRAEIVPRSEPFKQTIDPKD
jgi:glycosyltransferase involved in cell wall biosynthesis